MLLSSRFRSICVATPIFFSTSDCGCRLRHPKTEIDKQRQKKPRNNQLDPITIVTDIDCRRICAADLWLWRFRCMTTRVLALSYLFRSIFTCVLFVFMCFFECASLMRGITISIDINSECTIHRSCFSLLWLSIDKWRDRCHWYF